MKKKIMVGVLGLGAGIGLALGAGTASAAYCDQSSQGCESSSSAPGSGAGAFGAFGTYGDVHHDLAHDPSDGVKGADGGKTGYNNSHLVGKPPVDQRTLN